MTDTLSALSTAKRYQRLKFIVWASGLVVDFLALVFLTASGLSALFKEWAVLLSGRPSLQVLVYMTLFFHVFYLIGLPLSFYSGFLLEKSFHLSAEPPARWWRDELKKYLLSLGFFLIVMELLFFAVGRFPRVWWVLVSIGWLFLTLFLGRILPILLIPLFYPLKSFPAGPLKERLLRLCARCGVRVPDICEIGLSRKTHKANAAVIGIGAGRRVVLSDTLVGKFTADEVEMVLAHELGHHAKRHVMKNVVFNFFLTTGGFYLLHRLSGFLTRSLKAEGLTDLSAFPMMVLLAGGAGILALPLRNAFSRKMEYEADRFAMGLLPNREVFKSLMNKLARQNLSDPEPNKGLEFLLHDHPSVSNRIRRAA